MSVIVLSFLKKYPQVLLLILLLIIFFILALLTPVSYGGADDIVHYRFAKYSFQYPHLLLDHWAKPVFTLLASPFAQLGFWGVKLFNLLVGAFTAYILFLIAGTFNVKRPELIVILLFFTPVYTTMLLSGMTEILFSAVLVFAAYLFISRKHVLSSIIISLLPLVRTEGIIIWPLYIIGFIIIKKWKAIPFILTASLIYSIVGGLYFHDFLWLITHIPYTGTYDIYGHGELFHFVKANKLIFGIPLTLLFLIGVVDFFYRIKSSNSLADSQKPTYVDEILVILGPLLVYYIAHSLVWWKGVNSLGLIRVMAGVAPLVVIYSLRGLNFILNLFQNRSLKALISLSAIAVIVMTPFKVYEIPLELSVKDKTVKHAAEWFKSSPYRNKKYYVWECYFYFALGTNPYDTSKMADGIPDPKHPENFVKPGDIVIWDAHFSAVDGRFPLENIIDNPNYKLIKIFRPQKPFIAGGGTYQLCFFERLDSARNFNNRQILDSFASLKPIIREFLIFSENYVDSAHPNGLSIQTNQEFFIFKEVIVKKELWNENDMLNLQFKSKGEPVIIAVSIGNNQKATFYNSFSINNKSDSIYEYTILLPEIKKAHQKLKIYLWNKHKKSVNILQADIKLIKQCGK